MQFQVMIADPIAQFANGIGRAVVEMKAGAENLDAVKAGALDIAQVRGGELLLNVEIRG